MRQEAAGQEALPRGRGSHTLWVLGGPRLWEVAGTQCKPLFVASASPETLIYALHSHRHAHKAEDDPAQPSLGRWIN